jgi:hypothetical protein
MPTPRLLLLALGLSGAAPLPAQEVVPDVEYISGHEGFPHKVKGSLSISDSAVTFVGKHGTVLFVIPMAKIGAVSNSVEENSGSFGRKLALGIFASKKEEFVYLNWEDAERAEAIVLKTKGKMSPGIVAKLKFHQKRAVPPAVATPADSGAAVGTDSTAPS